jgi:hypothetical protein
VRSSHACVRMWECAEQSYCGNRSCRGHRRGVVGCPIWIGICRGAAVGEVDSGSFRSTASEPARARRQKVIVSALGQRNTGGFGILLESAHVRTGRVEIVVREIVPASSCVLTMATSQPVDVAIIPGTHKQIVFRHYSTVTDCG